MILVFYARKAMNVLVKLLAVKLITDARNRRYARPLFEKVAQRSATFSEQATGLLMREILISSKFLERLSEISAQTSSGRFQPTRYRAVSASPRLMTQMTVTTNGQT